MGAVKRILEDSSAIFQKCTCPPGTNGMDKLCPSCLAEYEENLVANYEANEDGEFVLKEAHDDRTAYYESVLAEYNKKQGA